MVSKKKTLLIGLSITFFTLVFSLFIAERIVRKIDPQLIYNFAIQRGLHIYDKGNKIPFTLQKNVNNSTLTAYTVEFSNQVSTNSFGQRSDEISLQKPADTYRILMLGDSMTFGWGVNNDQTFSSLLQKKLNNWSKENGTNIKYEVLNAGFTSGKTLDTYYVYLKNDGLKFNPDLVIENFFPYNDYTDLTEMNWDQTDENGLPKIISSKTQTIHNGDLVNTFSKNWMYEIPFLRNLHSGILLMSDLEKTSPRTVNGIKKLLNIPQNPPHTLSPADATYCLYSMQEKYCPQMLLDEINLSHKLFTATNSLIEENNSKLLVTVLPWPDEISAIKNDLSGGKEISEINPQKSIRDFLSANKINNLDLLPAFATSSIKDYFYERDGHLNSAGHEKIAEQIAAFLKQNYLK